MKPIILRPKSHDEWLKMREDGIGASEVAAILEKPVRPLDISSI